MDLEDILPIAISAIIVIGIPVGMHAYNNGLFNDLLSEEETADYSFELTTTSTTIGVGQTKTLVTEMAYTYIINDMEWSSSDDTVVSVEYYKGSANNIVQIKGLKTGEAIITASSGNYSTDCTVRVIEEAPDNEIKVYNHYSKTNRYAVLSGSGFESGVLTLAFNNKGYNTITLSGYTREMLEKSEYNNGEAKHDFKTVYMELENADTSEIVSSKTYSPDDGNSVVLPTGDIYTPGINYNVDFLVTLKDDSQYHITGSLVYKENDGSKDSTFIVKRPMSWRYDGRIFSFDLSFPYGLYSRYHNFNMSNGDLDNYNRFRNYDPGTGANWFTHSNEVSRAISDHLAVEYREEYGSDKSLATLDYANFILGFVQIHWYYALDDEQYVNGEITDNVDYWCYPMETIYSGCGDCEDTSILAATLFSDAGFKSGVFLIPSHAMAAVHVDDYSNPVPIPEDFEYFGYKVNDGGVMYYGCETTTKEFYPVGMGVSRLVNDSNGVRYSKVEIYTV